MPSPFSLGAQNADAAFDAFGLGKIQSGAGAVTSTQATLAVAHGLGAAPSFVLASGAHGTEAAPTWSATATTITFTRAATVTQGAIFYIAGIL